MTFRKVWGSIILGAGLVALLVFIVSGQVAGQEEGDSLLARMEPLLVDVQQQIPISVTLSLPGATATDAQTVTVPMALDLNLQIGVSGTMSPVITVTESTSPVVTVRDLLEAGEPLVDNQGIPYELEGVAGVEMLQLQSGDDGAGNFELLAEVQNSAGVPLRAFGLNARLTLYNEAGALLDTWPGFLSLRELQAGQTSTLTFDTTTPVERVGRYLVQIEADFDE